MAFGTQSPPGPPRSFVIYYAFLRLVAALTARGAREQIGIFTSESQLYPAAIPPPPCIRDRYASAASKWVAHLYQFHFITVFESRGSLAKRTATRNSHETSDGTRRIICLVSVLSRNLAYFVLKQIALNPEME